MHRTKAVISSEINHYKMVQYYVLNWDIKRVERTIAQLEEELEILDSYEKGTESLIE